MCKMWKTIFVTTSSLALYYYTIIINKYACFWDGRISISPLKWWKADHYNKILVSC